MGGERDKHWEVTDSNGRDTAILPRSVLSLNVRLITQSYWEEKTIE